MYVSECLTKKIYGRVKYARLRRNILNTNWLDSCSHKLLVKSNIIQTVIKKKKKKGVYAYLSHKVAKNKKFQKYPINLGTCS